MIFTIQPGNHQMEVYGGTIVLLERQKDGSLEMEWAGQPGDKFQIDYQEDTGTKYLMYVMLSKVEWEIGKSPAIYLQVIYNGGGLATEEGDVLGYSLAKFFHLPKGCPIPNM